MGKSERDPLFFPPDKYGPEPEAEEHSVEEIDPAEQQKGLRAVLLFGVILLAALFKICA
jgi:hypothetical protein